MRDAGWLQTPLFAPPITWRAPSMHALPSWAGAARVAIDIECRDDDLSALGPGVRRGGYICGVSFAIEDGPCHYLPIRHEGGGNIDESTVLRYLRDQAADFTGTIIGAGLQYDLDYLWQYGVIFGRATRHACVQIAEGLLDELQDSYGLDDILKRRGLHGKREGELEAHARAWGVHPKRGLWRLPAGAVGAYAEGDVRDLPALLRRQERELDDQGLQAAWDTECKVLLALLRMTRRGIRVHVDRLEEISTWARGIVAEQMAALFAATGVRVKSPANANQLEPALEALGFAVPTTPIKISEKTGKEVGGNASITNEWLTGLKHPVADLIVKARDFHKLDTSFCNGVRKHLIGDRLHPSFKQMRGGADDEDDDDEGARFGRTASRHPNAQNQPIRNKLYGKRWRSIYIPEDGEFWACGDYSQQEPRTTVHYAELCGLTGASTFADRYRNDPLTDSHTLFAEISGLSRDLAKPVFLGLCYGMGGGKLADTLGLPTEIKHKRDGSTYLGAGPEAQAILDQFNARVPFVRELAYLVSDKAKAKGFILLIDGRRCRFPKHPDGSYDWTFKALNRLVQGSAAIQTKNALIALDSGGFAPRLTVHDEFDFSTGTESRAREAAGIMSAALPLKVPSRVDVKIGTDYGNLRKLDAA